MLRRIMSQTVLSGTLFFAGTTQLYNTSAGKRVRYPYSSGTAVCRGKSRRPLFVSAIGMRPSEAASRIKEMAGPHTNTRDAQSGGSTDERFHAEGRGWRHLGCISRDKRDMKTGSIFQNIPRDFPEELFETLCATDSVKIERIVSRGHASPEGFWYDQDGNEFILVVQGSAGLTIEGEEGIVVLKAGDYMNIAAHVKHRIEWTDASCETVWLAVHY